VLARAVKGQSEKKKMKNKGSFFFLGQRANSLESSLIDALEQVTTTFTPVTIKRVGVTPAEHPRM
jgi:hypothetical protein